MARSAVHEMVGGGARDCLSKSYQQREKAICLTSRTRRNPGRRFFTCALGKRELQCGYFKWVDEVKESVVHSDEVHNPSLFSILASKVAKIERDVWLLKICFVY
ncbi:Zinc finger, GRF-type [Sesbania bispinosa]|nr:Zinc finger, GRF-type [Sesbania bispinosa]